MGSDTAGLRIAIGAACFVGGFFFWPLFILAVIMAMTLSATPEEQHEAQRPEPKAAPIERAGVRVEDIDWRARFLEACESPAESAFLAAMISSFSLQPDNGVLRAPGLTLNMQVDMQRYRLDFLANGWLIIEIDGAAWHSSPDAVARDRIRDKFFESYDYTVLRIPAKTVFNTPQNAVQMVQSALAEGRKPPSQKVEPTRKPVSAAGAVGGFLRAVSDGVDNANAYVRRASAVQQAMIEPQSIFDAETQVIEFAMERAASDIGVEKFRAQSAEHARHYDESYNKFKAMLRADNDEKSSEQSFRAMIKERVFTILEPQVHPEEITNETIKHEFSLMMEKRAAFFEVNRRKLEADETLSMLVRIKLLEMGCETCWQAIAPEGMTGTH